MYELSFLMFQTQSPCSTLCFFKQSVKKIRWINSFSPECSGQLSLKSILSHTDILRTGNKSKANSTLWDFNHLDRLTASCTVWLHESNQLGHSMKLSENGNSTAARYAVNQREYARPVCSKYSGSAAVAQRHTFQMSDAVRTEAQATFWSERDTIQVILQQNLRVKLYIKKIKN